MSKPYSYSDFIIKHRLGNGALVWVYLAHLSVRDAPWEGWGTLAEEHMARFVW